MVILYKYIFTKAYYFCIWAFKEREFPWAWAALSTSVVVFMTIVTLLKIFKIVMLPDRIDIYMEYHKYLSVAFGVAALWFVKRKDRYIQFLETCNKLSDRRRKVLSFLSTAYIGVLVVSFFWTTDIIRDSETGNF